MYILTKMAETRRSLHVRGRSIETVKAAVHGLVETMNAAIDQMTAASPE
ncbi:hypothetical protein RB2150_09539 [Rhodobacterales bacterium HTCC2150]|nr:hypothetical protein RB2150_09539 [Rhodobacterales bacterium HTCC2150] [Rhodobacteraceae bacterium HTCC2150]